ncbi:Protein kinase-like domain superfamily [Arabidopsis thaliana x Arabidopsis arenosa]|uniref:Protein kinase-like domain superfamily n=1 Tax=Arabidopsis thaliana x Arabidopsis arenosa TaxID=1240361 RepID=A0A8T2GMF3_9BRAS|nr:Protein kinase-like domain superfamily [Arabidopsis thaliana x Arabidopsis arenosa]
MFRKAESFCPSFLQKSQQLQRQRKQLLGLIPISSPDSLKTVLQTLSGKWGDVVEDLECLQVKPMKGAMTNEVFMVTWPIKDNSFLHRKLLVRVYGRGVGDLLFNRKDEIRTFEVVSRYGHGPKLLGRFAGGRIEEFINARTLSAADLRETEVSARVAAKLREFHGINIPGDRNVLIWDRMRNWLRQAKSLCTPEDLAEFGLDKIEAEIYLLEHELQDKCKQQEIGFCHNDLQYGNIMIDEDTNAITIIDYEYASYNPVAYDIANHFCEMAANYHSDTPHILDYTLYPGEEERRRFIHNYLSSSGEEPKEHDIKQLLKDAEKYTLASHLFWGLWGIISEYVNKIDFDYAEYSRQRFKQYWLRKPELLLFSQMYISNTK